MSRPAYVQNAIFWAFGYSRMAHWRLPVPTRVASFALVGFTRLSAAPLRRSHARTTHAPHMHAPERATHATGMGGTTVHLYCYISIYHSWYMDKIGSGPGPMLSHAIRNTECRLQATARQTNKARGHMAMGKTARALVRTTQRISHRHPAVLPVRTRVAHQYINGTSLPRGGYTCRRACRRRVG